MDYTQLQSLKKNHPGWRLLTLDSSPLIIGFFYHAFIQPNRRSIAQAELISLLEDYLFHIHKLYGNEVHPRPARHYLEEWARGEIAFLRKYYPKGSEEAEFDLTSASEKAIEWLKSLQQKQFVGTESRLLTVFQLLRELTQLTETNPKERIRELEHQKAQIDKQIADLQHGEVRSYDPTQIKERYFQIEETANQLLSDFREVEENFRHLDTSVRERITTSQKGKGELLDEIFGDQDAIQDSDQGKSFRAFWAFLMSPARQQELSDLVEKIMSLEAVQTLEPGEFLRQIRFKLLDAGEKVQRTSAALTEQLRRYLDDKVWLENKRIMTLMGDIERHAITLKQEPPKEKQLMTLDATSSQIVLPMSRGLFRPPSSVALNSKQPDEGKGDFDSKALYQQQYVDTARLQSNIRKMLQKNQQVSLQQLCKEHPLQQGLSELLSYLNLASQNARAVIDSEQQQQISWPCADGSYKEVTLPLVLFTR